MLDKLEKMLNEPVKLGITPTKLTKKEVREKIKKISQPCDTIPSTDGIYTATTATNPYTLSKETLNDAINLIKEELLKQSFAEIAKKIDEDILNSIVPSAAHTNSLTGIDFSQAGDDFKYNNIWYHPYHFTNDTDTKINTDGADKIVFRAGGVMNAYNNRQDYIDELEQTVKSLRDTNREHVELISWQIMEIDRLKAKLDDYENQRNSPAKADAYDPLSLTEDFIFGGEGRSARGSLVETLPTSEDLELADLEYFRQRLSSALLVPEQMQKSEQMGFDFNNNNEADKNISYNRAMEILE